MVERRFDANGDLKTVSEAMVKVLVDGEEKMSVAEGHGPVNALDIALRKDLGKFQREIGDLELVDFKVRILNGGTEAITRVLIEVARWHRRALVDGRRLRQHHRRLVPGADGFDHLQADEEPRHGRAGGGGVVGMQAMVLNRSWIVR